MPFCTDLLLLAELCIDTDERDYVAAVVDFDGPDGIIERTSHLHISSLTCTEYIEPLLSTKPLTLEHREHSSPLSHRATETG